MVFETQINASLCRFQFCKSFKSTVDTYKRSISNVQSGRVATRHNAQKDVHRNKVNNKGVTSPRANLKEWNNMQANIFFLN